MNVLYLSYDGLTDGLGRSQVLPYIIGLSKLGHKFTIVSFEKEISFKRDENTIRMIVDEVGIKWNPLMYTASPPILSTLYDVRNLEKTIERLHLETPFDIVHCRSYMTSIAGLVLKKKHKVKMVFDMRAFYADERVDGRIWNLKNPAFKAVYGYFKKKEIEFLENADYAISLTTKGKDIIHSWKHVKNNPVPVQVIPCCADLAHFHPSNINSSRKKELQQKLNLTEDDFVITYLGSIGTWYLLDEMLDFFKVLLEKKPNSKFLFITTDQASTILEPVKSKGIPMNRVAISPAKREEVPTFLSLANAAIFFIQPVFSKSGSSPTKHGEMLGMGLPVIANSGVGDVDSIIQDTKSGILIEEFSTSAYQNAVNQIDELLDIPISTLQDAAQKYYSLEEGVKKYQEVYEQITT
ncbi:MAG: glycosyltransferase involved in cell wall biosynthesis [Psychroserpens sp.]|jgi:glycosyltransferase involved in cell wall biosynthesis